MYFFLIENCLQIISETLCILINCLPQNILDMIILYFYYSTFYIYYLPLHIDELHVILHLQFLFLPFVAQQYRLINLTSVSVFFEHAYLLNLVLTKSDQDHVHMFQRICYEIFQIYLQEITYHFKHASHDNYLDFLIRNLFKLFSRL